MRAKLRADEVRRLAALQAYEIVDTSHEPEFEAVVELIAAICQTPIAVVNFIENGRQWFKAEIGLGVRQTPLEPSICAHAILQEELFVVPDTRLDKRFADNPLVTGDPYLRFYAGSLLKSSDGYPLGTLCVLDHKPRTLDAQQIHALRTLASHVMHLLELRVAKRSAEKLRRDLEGSLDAHQRLLGVVSHDLRAPVGVVRLCADTLNMQTEADIRPKEIGAQLARASSSMSTLIDDLVDYESIREGKLSLCKAPQIVDELLRNARDTFLPLAREAGIGLDIRPGPDLPPVDADADRVAQILANLIQNALKFTQRGGQVTVEAAPGQDGFVCVSVTDTGIGIAAEDLSRIFEAHFRSGEAQARGAGLGLAIVRSLVEAQGGTIEAKSILGEGSCLTFSLPICAEGYLRSLHAPD